MLAKEDIIDGLGQGEWAHSCRVSGLLEPRRAADCLQRPLHARFRQQLTPSVDMTSNVKSRLPLFVHFPRPLGLCPLEEPEPVRHDG